MFWLTSLKNLTRKKLRTTLTIFAILLGVSTMFAVISTVETAQKVTMKRLELYTGNADYTLQSKNDTFSEKPLSDLSQHHLVSNATGVLHKQAFLDMQINNLSMNQRRIRLTGLSSFKNELLSLEVLSGSLTNNKIILPEHTAQLLEKKVGDKMTFHLPKGKKVEEIGAIVKDTPLLDGPQSWEDANNKNWRALLPLTTVQEWNSLDEQIQEVRLKFSEEIPNTSIVKELEYLLNNDHLYFKEVILDEKQSNNLEDLYFMLYSIGGLAIFLSGFVLYNTFSTSIVERKNEIAVMKTIGFTNIQIIQLLLLEVVYLSVIGISLGVPLGVGLGNLLQSGLFSSFQSGLEYTMKFRWALPVTIFLGITIPIISSLIPIIHASRINIIKTMKNLPDEKVNTMRIRAIIGIILLLLAVFVNHMFSILFFMIGGALLFPLFVKWTAMLIKGFPFYTFESRVASNNIMRTLNRSSNMAFILALSISLGLFVSSIFSSLEKNIEQDISRTYGGDLQIIMNSPVTEEMINEIKQINGVEAIKSIKEQNVNWLTNEEKRQFSIISVDPKWQTSEPMFYSNDSEPELNEPGVYLGAFAFSEWSGKIGDTIEINTGNKETESVKVLGKVNTTHYGGYTAFMGEKQFNKYFPSNQSNKGFITIQDIEQSLVIKEKLLELFPYKVEDIQTKQEEILKQKRALPGVKALLNGLLFIAIGVSGIGILNTLIMNVMERIKEIGIMRAIGTSSFQIIKIINVEGLIIGLSGVLTGIGMGIGTIFLYASSINDPLIEFIVPLNTVFFSILFGIPISIISSTIPSFQAVKIHIVKAIKQE